MQIRFDAIIATSSSAVKIGDEGAIRVMLDVPVSDMSEALKLIAFGRKHVLKVSIEIEEEHDSPLEA